MIGVDNIPYLDLWHKSDDSYASTLCLIRSIRPSWTSQLGIVEITGGINNTLLKVVNQQDGVPDEKAEEDAILVRIFGAGTVELLDREREARNHVLLMRHGLASELLALFANGMLYKYVPGTPARPEDIQKPEVSTAIARKLAEWHARIPSTHHEGSVKSTVWTVLQHWILALPSNCKVLGATKADLQRELDRLVRDLGQLDQNRAVFCHCDLLSGNIIMLPKRDNGPVEVAFIDYEYAMPSPVAFDIANHFAEWTGFECDYHVVPTRSQRRHFIVEYVRAYGLFIQGVDQDEEAKRLFAHVDLYRGLPGFFWAIWSLVKASLAEFDFDYAAYAEIRMGEYFDWRGETDGNRKQAGKETSLREQRWAQES